MAAFAQRKPYIPPGDYLEIERAAAFKSEYLNGEMWADGRGDGIAYGHCEQSCGNPSRRKSKAAHAACTAPTCA